MCDVRRRVRCVIAQLIARSFARSALCSAVAVLALLGATPAPKAPERVDLTKIQPKSLLPKVALHTEFVVEINKLGQVTKIRSAKPSKDRTYNLQTYGNALQAFIRTEDDKAIPGVYRLTYDYSPKTTRIRRDVALISAGGVDVNAEGAANRMLDDIDRAHAAKLAAEAKKAGAKPGAKATPAAKATHAETSAPGPAPSVNIQRLPDLPNVMNSSTPKP